VLNVFSDRPAEDILGRVVHLKLGTQVFDLPVLTIAGNKRWKAQLDTTLTSLLDGVENTDLSDTTALLGALSRQTDELVGLLISYDTSHVLPTLEELEEIAYEDQLIAAVREVWRAANPFVVGALEAAAAALQESASSAPTSTSQRPTAGRRKTSRPT
jgi:hypothetical protein